ncbi:F0F1 ATP synthase subunit delta [Nakamurella endophytica]|uniref:ATP synthase subunit delta n=1 Tax=Nakamurella endophytica TaxID=1748367 RepID=A0A917TER6_9ACTN|nr:F0F1 ATP synthase subunit delta [Nakamurella endophytica]GGM18015.1 ATP synthase subunit delta [Nakamurella endophytica]
MEHIASRQSLEDSTRRLLSVAAPLDDAGLEQLGGELAAVGGLLHRETALRRTLSETTTPMETRVGIMDRLLAGKVSQPTRTLVDHVLRQPWASGADLRDGFDRLGRTAMFLRAERLGELDDVEDQLFRFGRIIAASPELSVVLDDPTVTGPARAQLVRRLLEGRAHPLTVQLLTALAREPGGRSYLHGVRELVDQAAERRDKVVAVVQTAVALTAEDRSRLVAALGRIYGRAVTTHEMVVPALQGGIRVLVQDEVIDGSVAGRLDGLRRRLAGRA